MAIQAGEARQVVSRIEMDQTFLPSFGISTLGWHQRTALPTAKNNSRAWGVRETNG